MHLHRQVSVYVEIADGLHWSDVDVVNLTCLTRILHCKKKLALLLFDFGIINTTDDDWFYSHTPFTQLTTHAAELYAWFTTAVV